MFKFSIRDSLWLTLVVAIALGWLNREHTLKTELAGARDDANQWRMAAGGLEEATKKFRWKIAWNFADSVVLVYKPTDEQHGTYFQVDFAEPSDPRGTLTAEYQ